jgi:hypothetical protein
MHLFWPTLRQRKRELRESAAAARVAKRSGGRPFPRLDVLPLLKNRIGMS